jgi:hypothetical protein
MDPIFGLIAQHRRLWCALGEAPDDEEDAVLAALWSFERKLIGTPPTTLEGAAALLDYARAGNGEGLISVREDPDAAQLLIASIEAWLERELAYSRRGATSPIEAARKEDELKAYDLWNDPCGGCDWSEWTIRVADEGGRHATSAPVNHQWKILRLVSRLEQWLSSFRQSVRHG